MFGSLEAQLERDRRREDACKQANLGLVKVPYSWDLKKETLMEAIQKERPDIKCHR